ncbi:helix-turn-helix domain-containing protein [Rhizomonospora bruguierae]|uniref:helix-turn-helix domain-containing protein n=1 Tax=Rhizomonospora bruguierae TaxID=1581705 RepID=UPI001BD010E2|nr:helix-turn-helix domain-containing protein [Micromonospora sp. NBRC 107566]
MPRPPAAHGTPSRWRVGCRCPCCLSAHNADTASRRRAASDDRFPLRQRRRLLRLIAQGAPVTEAAELVGVTYQAVHARTRTDPAWQGLLDQALMTGRRVDVPHGTESGYRQYRCRCPECRRAHHPG